MRRRPSTMYGDATKSVGRVSCADNDRSSTASIKARDGSFGEFKWCAVAYGVTNPRRTGRR
jgi:hypothetical protein